MCLTIGTHLYTYSVHSFIHSFRESTYCMSENTGSNKRLNKTCALKKTQARQWFEVITITKESSLDLLDHRKCPAM